MNTIKNLALRAAAAAGMLGVAASNALAQPQDVTPITDITDTAGLKTQIQTIANTFIGFIGLIAAIMLLYGAYLYITAGANEDNAKKGKTVIVYAIIGLVVAVLIYVIVNVSTDLISG